jgi:hypothetical protein
MQKRGAGWLNVAVLYCALDAACARPHDDPAAHDESARVTVEASLPMQISPEPLEGWPITWGGAFADDASALVIGTDAIHVVGWMVEWGADANEDSRWLALEGNRRTFAATFTLAGEFVQGFRLDGPLAHTRPRIASDAAGAIYVTAEAEAERATATSPRFGSAYAIKLLADGSVGWRYSWPTVLGSVQNVQMTIATLDEDAIIASVRSNDAQSTAAVSFVARVDASGQRLWETELSGTLATMTIDDRRAIYAYGSSDAGGGAGIRAAGATWVAKLDEDGRELWRRSWTDGSVASLFQVLPVSAVGLPEGGVIVAGNLASTREYVDFDPSDGEALVHTGGNATAFVSAFDGEGDHLWAFGWNDRAGATVSDVAVGDNGEVFVTGWYSDRLVPTPENPISPNFEAVVIELSPAGEAVSMREWSGFEEDRAYGVAVLEGDDLVVAGGFEREVDFGMGASSELRRSRGHSDVFLTRFPSTSEHGRITPPGPPRPICRLDAQSVPRDFDACVAAGGRRPQGANIGPCILSWCPQGAEFDECRELGGALIATDGAMKNCCEIEYPRSGCPCRGNVCD